MKKIVVIAMVALMTLVVFAGCAQTAEEAPAPEKTETPQQTATVDEPVVEAPPEPVLIKVVGSTSVSPVIDALAEMYMEMYEHVTINVESTGSGAGVTSASDGTADIGMASREVKDEELTAAPDLKVSVLCLDGVAVVVNKNNPVSDLSLEQIKDIFTGKVTNWKQVGGNDAKIQLYTRDSGSGTRTAFTELFLDDEIDDTIFLTVDSNGAMGTGIEGDANGIGYMSVGFVPEYGVNMVKVGGVEGSIDNLKSGVYPYFRNFNLLTLGDPEGEIAAFLDFCLSDPAALDYIASKGYIPHS